MRYAHPRKWTPGPWFNGGKLIGGCLEVLADGGRMQVARVNGKAGEQEANAALIAAAPELYEALAGFVDWFNAQELHHVIKGAAREPHTRARAALAAARGEGGEK